MASFPSHRMNDFAFLLPEQSAKATFYAHGTDEVAEWSEGDFVFTLTRYADIDEWDIFLRHEGAFLRECCTMDAILSNGLRIVVSAMIFDIEQERSRVRANEDAELATLRTIVATAKERSET